MSPTKRRWVCPRCGAGVLAPSRPRKDDTRRYCLACSEETGRLVERTCPAQDAARDASRARAVARRTERRARTAAYDRSRQMVGDVNLLDEAKRLWKLPSLRAVRGAQVPMPIIELRRRPGAESSGRCSTGEIPARITMTAGNDAGEALETLLHELTHAALPWRERHTPRFWSVLRASAGEGWPEIRFAFNELGTSRGWQVDSWIAGKIGDHLAEHH